MCDEHFYYFAYGSNLLSERLLLTNPSACFFGVGRLADFSFGFGGPPTTNWRGCSATIAHVDLAETSSDGVGQRFMLKRYDDGCVYGVVWRLHVDHLGSLDAQESGYDPIRVDVKLNDPSGGVRMTCRSYVMTGVHHAGLLRRGNVAEENKTGALCHAHVAMPSPHYKHVIISGAMEHRLPAEYIKFLASFQDNGYAGPVKFRLKAIEHLNEACDNL